MRAVPGRVVCPRCGENNFDTQANCWKCGSSLAGMPSANAALHRAETPTPAAHAAPSASAAPVGRVVDPAVAIWAAVALALLFPGVAVPVGIVFLMLDDRRKAEIGRITLVWGVVFSLLHLLLTAWWLRGMYEYVRPFLPGAAAASQQARPNDPAPAIHLPGEQQGAPEIPFPEPPAGR
jgi:hypothetical protein